MRSKTGWIIVVVIGLVLLFVFPGIFMMGRTWTGGYGGMMGSGLMGGYGFWNPLGLIGMAMMWLVPLGLLVLLVLGVVALVNGLTGSRHPATPTAGLNCSNCGKPTESNWMTCPYCGKSLK